MRWDFLSQPLAVTSAMVSRAGMMWFLLTCFSASDKKIRLSIIVCSVVQVAVNMVTIVQIIVQCGPNPYQTVSNLLLSAWPILISSQTDRVQYFHYMWTPLPEDGSVKCQSPSVQTTVGFVQGGMWNDHTSAQRKANYNSYRIQHSHRFLPCRACCRRTLAILPAYPSP